MKEEEAPVDEALKIKLPKGSNDQVTGTGACGHRAAEAAAQGSGPRQVPKETLLDDKLAQAVKRLSDQERPQGDGQSHQRHAHALNREGETEKASPIRTRTSRGSSSTWSAGAGWTTWGRGGTVEQHPRVLPRAHTRATRTIIGEKIIVGRPP